VRASFDQLYSLKPPFQPLPSFSRDANIPHALDGAVVNINTYREAGLLVELLETRHVRDAFKAMPVKTDRTMRAVSRN
jgi:hypothetical protein